VLYLHFVFDHTRFPAHVAHSTKQPAVRYSINAAYFALPEAESANVGKPVHEVEGYRIYRSTDVKTVPPSALPVYETSAGGSLLVPTGAVFVRFTESEQARARTKDIQQAGYRISEIPPYAPNAAWVRAASGSLGDAMVKLDKLASLSGVENVAPQFVTQRRPR
jgi:hypothetical protein